MSADDHPNPHANPDILLILPEERIAQPPEVSLPDGYTVRTYEPRDGDAWVHIHRLAVPTFGVDRLRPWLERYLTLALPESILFASCLDTGELVATSGCIHQTRDGMFPFGGELAWVATMPEHQGRGLATALCAMCTRRLIDIGYTNVTVQTGDDMLAAMRVYLTVQTGDDMLAAMRVYLRLGFEPLLYEPDMEERWAVILRHLDIPIESVRCHRSAGGPDDPPVAAR